MRLYSSAAMCAVQNHICIQSILEIMFHLLIRHFIRKLALPVSLSVEKTLFHLSGNSCRILSKIISKHTEIVKIILCYLWCISFTFCPGIIPMSRKCWRSEPSPPTLIMVAYLPISNWFNVIAREIAHFRPNLEYFI